MLVLYRDVRFVGEEPKAPPHQYWVVYVLGHPMVFVLEEAPPHGVCVPDDEPLHTRLVL